MTGRKEFTMWNKKIRFKTKKWVELPGETFDEYMNRCYSPETLAEIDSASIGEIWSEWYLDGGDLPTSERVDVYENLCRPKKKPHRYAKAVEKVAREKAKYEWYHGLAIPDGLDELPFN